MAIDRKKFFDGIRQGPFPGTLSEEAVRGVTAILDEWERRGLTDLRWLAYMLATVLAECGKNMLPVREGFARSDAAARSYVASKHYKYAKVEGGQVYYGRGLVQLTWLDNYRKMSAITGLDLVNFPDLALEPANAAKIMFDGMIRGSFTGKKLGDYFNATAADWTNARRIINGLDRASEIAGYAKQFHADLLAAGTAAAPPPKSDPPKPPVQQAGKDAAKKGVFALIVGAIVSLFAWLADHPGIALVATVALVGLAVFGWRWWKARKERKAKIDAAGTNAVADALNPDQGSTSWNSTGDQSQEPLPPSPPSSAPSSEQLSAARLALSSVASPGTPSPRSSKPTQPPKRSARPSRKTHERKKSSSASRKSAVRKSSPKPKLKSRGSSKRG